MLQLKCKFVFLCAILGFAVVFASGCTSMTSTLYSNDGCQDCERVKKHLKGVPITLNVPSHIRVSIIEKNYANKDIKNGMVAFIPDLKTRHVVIDPIKQKELFTVDFKRPAAGTLKYNLDFDVDRQYIKKMNN